MATVTIRNLPDEVVAKLKARAKTNQRSLEAELREIVAAAANTPTRGEFIAMARRIAEMTKDRPHTDSVVLIREDRDR